MAKAKISKNNKDERTPRSPVKPWESELVYYNPKDSSPPLQGGMVRIKAKFDTKWTMGLEKNTQQNNVVILVTQDGIDLKGNQTSTTYNFNVKARFIEPADDGRFIDVSSWVLKKNKITDKYGNLLDFNGKVMASKPQQKRWSGAGMNESVPGNINESQKLKETVRVKIVK